MVQGIVINETDDFRDDIVPKGFANRREAHPVHSIDQTALAHGATIVPFAAVGAEDALDIVADADDLMASPLGRLVKRLRVRPEAIPPIVRPKRRERFYFEIGEPIVAEGTPETLRDRTKAAVEAGIARLLAYR